MFRGAPGLSLRSNPGLKLANAFGVFSTNFKLRHYPILLTWGRCGLISSLLNELGSVELSGTSRNPDCSNSLDVACLGRTSIVC